MTNEGWQDWARDRRRSVPGCPDPVPAAEFSEPQHLVPRGVAIGQVRWEGEQQFVWTGESWVPVPERGTGPEFIQELTGDVWVSVKDLQTAPVAVGTLRRVGSDVVVWTGVQWVDAQTLARDYEWSINDPVIENKSLMSSALRAWMTHGREAMQAWKDAELDSPTGLPQPPAPFPVLFQEVARFVFELWSQEIVLYLMRVGFWDDGRTFGDEMALLHSEVSEALQEFRENGFTSRVRGDGKPEGVASEFADLFIRLLDDCVRRGISLPDVFRTKQDFNWTRPYRHGNRSL